jgi:hypothetical protein
VQVRGSASRHRTSSACCYCRVEPFSYKNTYAAAALYNSCTRSGAGCHCHSTTTTTTAAAADTTTAVLLLLTLLLLHLVFTQQISFAVLHSKRDKDAVQPEAGARSQAAASSASQHAKWLQGPVTLMAKPFGKRASSRRTRPLKAKDTVSYQPSGGLVALSQRPEPLVLPLAQRPPEVSDTVWELACAAVQRQLLFEDADDDDEPDAVQQSSSSSAGGSSSSTGDGSGDTPLQQAQP